MKNILIVKDLTEDIPLHTPFMREMQDGNLMPAIYIRTPQGTLCADVESMDGVGYDAAYISFIPEGSGDTADVARIRTIDEHPTVESDLEVSFYGDVYDESPTNKNYFSREDIKEAFDID